MKTKRILAGITTVVCSLSLLASPIAAFADGETIEAPNSSFNYEGKEIKADTEIKTPTIKVELPTSAAFALNPYHLTASVSGAATSVSAAVVSTSEDIKNESDVAISMGCEVQGSIDTKNGANFALSAKSLTGKESKKTALVFMEMTTGSYAYVGQDFSEDDIKTGFDKAVAAKQANIAVLTTSKQTKAKMLTIAKSDGTAKTGAVAFGGDANTLDSLAWSSKDVLGVTIKYTFVPILN